MNILDTLKDLNGYWKYDGGKYIAELTSGKVSDKFINCGVLTCRPNYLMDACACLLYDFSRQAKISTDYNATFPWEDTIFKGWAKDRKLHVCGPAMGGVTMAYEMARQLGGTAIFTEPYVHSGRTVKKIQRLKRFEIPEGATVLFVEDVITTGKSTREMVEAVLQSEDGIKFRRERKILPHVLCLVNRSGEKKIRNEGFDPHDWDEDAWGLDIVSLAEVKARTWDTVEEAMSDLWAGEGKYSQSDVHAGCVLPPTLEAVRPKDSWEKLTKGE